MSLTILDQNDKKELEKKIDDAKTETEKQIDEAIANATGPIDPSRIKDMYYDNGFVAGTEILVDKTLLESTWSEQGTDPVTYNSITLFAGTLEVGKKYYVTYNGVPHVFTAITFPGMDNCTAIGGFNLTTGSVADSTAPYELIVGDGALRIISTKKEDVTVSIHEAVEDLHQIHPKYIKDMYYEEGGLVEILPETTLTAPDPENSPGIFQITENYPELIVGTTYKVKWNGVEYTGTAINGSDVGEAEGTVMLFNDGVDLSTGEGLVFAIVYMAGVGFMPSDPNGGTELTVAIFADDYVMHKLPEKFLPMDDIIQAVKDSIPTWEGGSY